MANNKKRRKWRSSVKSKITFSQAALIRVGLGLILIMAIVLKFMIYVRYF